MVRSAKSNINLCLANRFRAIHPVRVKSPLCRAGRLFLHEETGDGACIDDEICELVSEQLRAAAVCSHKQMQDRLFVGDFVHRGSPRILFALEAIAVTRTQEEATRRLRMTNTDFGRLYSRLREPGHSFVRVEQRSRQRGQSSVRYKALSPSGAQSSALGLNEGRGQSKRSFPVSLRSAARKARLLLPRSGKQYGELFHVFLSAVRRNAEAELTCCARSR